MQSKCIFYRGRSRRANGELRTSQKHQSDVEVAASSRDIRLEFRKTRKLCAVSPRVKRIYVFKKRISCYYKRFRGNLQLTKLYFLGSWMGRLRDPLHHCLTSLMMFIALIVYRPTLSTKMGPTSTKILKRAALLTRILKIECVEVYEGYRLNSATFFAAHRFTTTCTTSLVVVDRQPSFLISPSFPMSPSFLMSRLFFVLQKTCLLSFQRRHSHHRSTVLPLTVYPPFTRFSS